MEVAIQHLDKVRVYLQKIATSDKRGDKGAVIHIDTAQQARIFCPETQSEEVFEFDGCFDTVDRVAYKEPLPLFDHLRELVEHFLVGVHTSLLFLSHVRWRASPHDTLEGLLVKIFTHLFDALAASPLKGMVDFSVQFVLCSSGDPQHPRFVDLLGDGQGGAVAYDPATTADPIFCGAATMPMVTIADAVNSYMMGLSKRDTLASQGADLRESSTVFVVECRPVAGAPTDSLLSRLTLIDLPGFSSEGLGPGLTTFMQQQEDVLHSLQNGHALLHPGLPGRLPPLNEVMMREGIIGGNCLPAFVLLFEDSIQHEDHALHLLHRLAALRQICTTPMVNNVQTLLYSTRCNNALNALRVISMRGVDFANDHDGNFEIQRLAAQFVALQSRYDHVSAEGAESERERVRLAEEIKELREGQGALEQVRRDYSARLAAAEQDILVVDMKVKREIEEKAELQSRLKVAEEDKQMLEEELAAVHSNLTRLNVERKALRTRNDELQGEVKSSNEKCLYLTQCLEKAAYSSSMAVSELEAARKKELEGLHEKVERGAARVRELERELEKRAVEVEQHRSQISSLERMDRANTHHILKQQDEIHRLYQELQSVQIECVHKLHHVEMNRRHSEGERRAQELIQKQDLTIERLQHRIDAFEKNRGEEKAEEALRSELAKLREEHKERVAELEAANRALQDRAEKLQGELDEAQKEVCLRESKERKETDLWKAMSPHRPDDEMRQLQIELVNQKAELESQLDVYAPRRVPLKDLREEKQRVQYEALAEHCSELKKENETLQLKLEAQQKEEALKDAERSKTLNQIRERFEAMIETNKRLSNELRDVKHPKQRKDSGVARDQPEAESDLRKRLSVVEKRLARERLRSSAMLWQHQHEAERLAQANARLHDESWALQQKKEDELLQMRAVVKKWIDGTERLSPREMIRVRKTKQTMEKLRRKHYAVVAQHDLDIKRLVEGNRRLEAEIWALRQSPSGTPRMWCPTPPSSTSSDHRRGRLIEEIKSLQCELRRQKECHVKEICRLQEERQARSCGEQQGRAAPPGDEHSGTDDTDLNGTITMKTQEGRGDSLGVQEHSPRDGEEKAQDDVWEGFMNFVNGPHREVLEVKEDLQARLHRAEAELAEMEEQMLAILIEHNREKLRLQQELAAAKNSG